MSVAARVEAARTGTPSIEVFLCGGTEMCCCSTAADVSPVLLYVGCLSNWLLLLLIVSHELTAKVRLWSQPGTYCCAQRMYKTMYELL